ncbi:MAG: c-type cytochrome [Verrucomicrobiae bacterium]|nr:c-type cytochrome [Verrucomicrobiae bacterium]
MQATLTIPLRTHQSDFCLMRIAAMILMGLVLPASSQDDPFADFIRKTEALAPEEAQKSFHLPPGFEIQLVAAEPDISKPMNLAFDERGRLWMTQSREYPFPVPTNSPGRDEIKILSDFDESGRARRVTTFADGLNIPIGLYPYRGGAIAFSIPAIYHFEDTDGDGRADRRTVLYSGQGYDLDTHGLTSSFRRGYDGWLYACHGYRNTSTLRGTDGHAITMNSGNTYRMRLDGSRVEQFTWGQVNPFGLQFDPLGDLFSADCHSSPVYQLLRGAYYPSFGKPHDGLGFGPNICPHTHGSTAICGIVVYHDDRFPPEYRGNSLIGNVMTCRINRDSYPGRNSTRNARQEPDFLRSDDPWFRPVDLTLGPDGAIYVADFYNRIIGHYEVPLDHPGRDRERGRIWRIIYRGDGKRHPVPQDFDLSQSTAAELGKQLAHPNLTVRMLATEQLTDRIGPAAIRPVEKLLSDKKSTAEQKVHGLWVLHRLRALNSKMLAHAARDSDHTVRTHAMRVVSETADWTPTMRDLAVTGLRDADPFVQRAAADAFVTHPRPAHLAPLLEARRRVPPDDPALLHTVRMALRNQLQAPGAFQFLNSLPLEETHLRAIADVTVGVKSPDAGSYALAHAYKVAPSRTSLMTCLRHAARYAPESEVDALVIIAQEKFLDDLDAQFDLFKSVQEAFAQRGASLSAAHTAWAAELAGQLLAPTDAANTPWIVVPLSGTESSSNPWMLQQRPSADGDQASAFFSSLPAGESLTGILRSRTFAIPPQLSFYLAGHDGHPERPPQRRNLVRLIAADTREVLAQAAPPRNDEAQRIAWDLRKHTGRQGILEIVDGHAGTAFAWLAAGRFEPAVVAMPEAIPNGPSQRQQDAAHLVRTVPLPEFESQMTQVFSEKSNPLEARAAAAAALVALKPETYIPDLARSLGDTNASPAFRETMAGVLAGLNSSLAREAVLEALLTAPHRLQLKLAQSLAGNPAGAEALLQLAESRKISPQLLLDRAVRERLAAARLPQYRARYAKLTAGLSPVNAEMQKLIATRLAGFLPGRSSAERGALVYEKSCAACHQIAGKGAIIGPQLDGVGSRGLERLIEDVIDANRNVDPAFRTSNLTLRDDTAITGLLRREEGEVLVFADATGREIAVPKREIVENRESELSLMPSNFGDILTVEEFNDLMAYLLAQGAK